MEDWNEGTHIHPVSLKCLPRIHWCKCMTSLWTEFLRRIPVFKSSEDTCASDERSVEDSEYTISVWKKFHLASENLLCILL